MHTQASSVCQPIFYVNSSGLFSRFPCLCFLVTQPFVLDWGPLAFMELPHCRKLEVLKMCSPDGQQQRRWELVRHVSKLEILRISCVLSSCVSFRCALKLGNQCSRLAGWGQGPALSRLLAAPVSVYLRTPWTENQPHCQAFRAMSSHCTYCKEGGQWVIDSVSDISSQCKPEPPNSTEWKLTLFLPTHLFFSLSFCIFSSLDADTVF